MSRTDHNRLSPAAASCVPAFAQTSDQIVSGEPDLAGVVTSENGREVEVRVAAETMDLHINFIKTNFEGAFRIMSEGETRKMTPACCCYKIVNH